MLLADTNDKIDLVTSAAVTVDVVATFEDQSSTTTMLAGVGGKKVTAISTATTTDIVSSPAANVIRKVKYVTIRNRASATPVDVTVRFNDNATIYEMHKVTLQAGDCLQYAEGLGFYVIAASSSPQVRTSKLGSDQSNSTTTPTELTGMSLTTGVGTFAFQYSILYQAAATTTGVRFSVNHTGTVTALVANVSFVSSDTTATATQLAGASQAVTASTGGLLEAFSARAKSTAGWGTTVSVDAANSDMLTIIDGLMIVTADGDIELWHGSEVAAASTVKAGTSLVLIRTG
jgi:hypothetical protein